MSANSDIIVIYGQDNISAAIHNELTFSQPVKDPILLVLSMGQPSGYFVNYDFDQPFTVLSSGNGYWGGNSSGSITALSGDVLAGEEGHGAIQFNGEISKISWTASPYENWHGFTVGMPVTTTPEVTSTFGALIMGLISVGALKKIRG